ncbi:MAG: OmpH family outer membrane protein [Verrucomicrobiaceae bacterium]|nr:OmpH family outer membrane protein [Verrucomicrobiaceae bacterium]
MRFLSSLLVVLVASSISAADLKVGVVDMTKAFTEYYKTKDASSKMKGNKDKAMSEMNERFATYKNLLNEVQKKQKEAQDPILTQEGRAKAGAEFQDKLKEARALEQEINEFQQRRSMQLKQEEMQLQKGLYDEIVAVVKDKSKSSSYDLVFDKSGVSMTTVPVLLYYKDATEFTDEVIVELNKNAPADSGKKDKEEDSAKEKGSSSKKSK